MRTLHARHPHRPAHTRRHHSKFLESFHPLIDGGRAHALDMLLQIGNRRIPQPADQVQGLRVNFGQRLLAGAVALGAGDAVISQSR